MSIDDRRLAGDSCLALPLALLLLFLYSLDLEIMGIGLSQCMKKASEEVKMRRPREKLHYWVSGRHNIEALYV